jgi:predicted Rossmann-fold nucleotide-binding protein
LATHFEGRETSKFLDKEIKTDTYLERTLKLIALGDAFVIFRGGTGTISEWGMAWGLARIYYGHHKPLIFFGKFWREIIEVIEKTMNIRPEERLVYRIVSSPHEVLQALRDYDRQYVGSHPHYQYLTPEKDFVV